MSRLVNVQVDGAIAVPSQGIIESVIVANTTGGAVSVGVDDGEGGVDLDLEIPSDATVQFRFSGLAYRGGLTVAGSGATNVVMIEIG